MSRATYTHKFVKAFPEKLEDGVLYVSVEFGTAAHLCFCGCKSEVYTRFSPRDWSMSFDGETVSLNPSIGNWSFACQSHYVLSRGHVRWADKWSRQRIEYGRAIDRERKERHYSGAPEKLKPSPAPGPAPLAAPKVTPSSSVVVRIARWLLGK